MTRLSTAIALALGCSTTDSALSVGTTNIDGPNGQTQQSADSSSGLPPSPDGSSTTDTNGSTESEESTGERGCLPPPDITACLADCQTWADELSLFDVPTPLSMQRTSIAVAADVDGRIALAFYDAEQTIIVMHGDDGAQLWTAAVELRTPTMVFDPKGGLIVSTYIPSGNRRLTRFDARGVRTWSLSQPDLLPPLSIAQDGLIWLTVGGRRLVSVDQDGNLAGPFDVEGSYPAPERRVIHDIVGTGATLIVSGEDQLFASSQAEGWMQGSTAQVHSPNRSPPSSWRSGIAGVSTPSTTAPHPG